MEISWSPREGVKYTIKTELDEDGDVEISKELFDEGSFSWCYIPVDKLQELLRILKSKKELQ